MWSARHRWPVVLLWFVATIGLFVLSTFSGGIRTLDASGNPNERKLEAQQAYDVFRAGGTNDPSEQVVLVIDGGPGAATDPAFRASVAALVGQLASMPVTNGTARPGGLGYRGFSIVVQRAGQADQTFVAYRGAVTRPGDAPGTYEADPRRTIESALLETGRSHLTATEISVVEADLAQP